MFPSFRTNKSHGRAVPRSRRRLFLEELETRTVPSLMTLDTLTALAPPSAVMSPQALPNASTTTSGPYQPSQIRTAYGFDRIPFLTSNGTPNATIYNNTAGAGQTIAIVDAFYDPYIQSDLSTFDTKFGLPGNKTDGGPNFLSIVGIDSQTGNVIDPSTLPVMSNWAGEISLDVEWAHAIAPQAKILLIESSAGSHVSDMVKAVQYASAHASIVSMSWGEPESNLGSATELADDANFQASGVTFIASSGDSGAPAFYPAASPNVLAVGGTHLVLNTNSTINSETGWGFGKLSPIFGGSGGGYSLYEKEPGYQSSYAASNYVQSTLKNKVLLENARGNPDVAYDADPSTGFYIYDSVPSNGQSGWEEAGGTSAGAPQWAALIAIADQARAAQAVPPGPLSTAGTLSALYGAASTSSYGTNFRDILSGNNGYSAKTGYDLVTGLGSPKANALVGTLLTAVNPPGPGAPVSGGSGSSGGGNGPHAMIQPASAPSTSGAPSVAVSSGPLAASVPHLFNVAQAPALAQPLDPRLLTAIPSTATPSVSSSAATVVAAPEVAASFGTFTGVLPSTTVNSTRAVGAGEDTDAEEDISGVPMENDSLPSPGSDTNDPQTSPPSDAKMPSAAPARGIEESATGASADGGMAMPMNRGGWAMRPGAEGHSIAPNAGALVAGLLGALGPGWFECEVEVDTKARRQLFRHR
jgi:hypothetical protein